MSAAQELSAVELARAYLDGRRAAYSTTFRNPMGEEVLRDLAKFCRANESTADQNRDLANVLEGRRQVWLRIQQHLRLTDEQIWRLYDGR